MTLLRQVLQTFEQTGGALSLGQMARELNIEPALLDEMIGYWVRKGKLREVAASGCETCAFSSACCTPLVKLPRRYELAQASAEPPPACPHCAAQRAS